MYLSNKEISLLTDAVKYFEVGFRSYIAEIIINKYNTIDDYRNAVNEKRDNYVSSSIILSGRIEALLDNLSNEQEVKKIYNLLSETNIICKNNKRKEIIVDKKDAFLLISELLAITYIFCSELFSNMVQGFSSREEYMYLAEQYRTIRNNLFHPEASISDLNYIEVNKFISILTDVIDDHFFWFASKEELKNVLDTLSISVNNSIKIINNLKSVPKQKNKFVCRTNEIDILKNYLLGNELGLGRMHYILVSGFGGMGKTALVIEVIMQIMRDYNNNTLRSNKWFDFILFFSAKEEVLDIEENGGKINRYQLKSQISSLQDIKREVKEYLGVDNLVNYEKNGLIVIDNFETLSETEKAKINQFIIYESNQNIQYIITSRNEEHIDTNYQLPIRIFNEEDGCEFIDRYLEENSLFIVLDELSKKKLIKLSKGNTLVLVLSLHRLNQGIGISTIEKELLSIGSETINNIVSFMSKNAFDEIYNQFQLQKDEVEKILQIMVMYDEPIDKYSLMVLSHTDMLLVDEVVNSLISGLILEEQREEIQINEFAKTYLLIKFKPNNIEYMMKQDEISDYKRNLSIKKNKLLDCRKRNPQIDIIFKEWQPNNLIDELAIVDAFEAYTYFNVGRVVNNNGYKSRFYTLDSVNKYFEKIEVTSTHPYIYAQKARILLPLLRYKKENGEKIKESLKDSFEKTIISVETQYINIKGTISYASILRELGRFYLEDNENSDFNKAANYSEKAQAIYEKIDKSNRYYFFTIRNLAKAYMGVYNKTKEKAYIVEALKLWNQIVNNNNQDISQLKKEAEKNMDSCIKLL